MATEASPNRDDSPRRVLISRLSALELALDVARREAGRAGGGDIDEALGELCATIVERRRREAREPAALTSQDAGRSKG
jgi:hypothetical protein